MTLEKVLEVVGIYREEFKKLRTKTAEIPEVLAELLDINFHYKGNECALVFFDLQRDNFEIEGILKAQFPPEVYDQKFVTKQGSFVITRDINETLSHCHWMLDEVEEFVRQGRMEKMFRWMGFIIGCLFSSESTTTETLEVCHSMVYEIEKLINTNQKEKMFVWLGIIQGCLLCGGIYTLNELKNHSRP